MSGRIPFKAILKAMLPVGVTALLSVGAQAATPNAPAEKEKAQTPTARPPTNTQKPPDVHRPASFTRQTPLSQAVDSLRNSTTPPLSIVVLWKPIGDNAGIYSDTPIGIDGISGLRVGQVLDLLVLSLSAGAPAKIGYTIDHGVITISTTDTLPAPKLVTRVYDIRDLIAPPGRYSPATMGFGMGYGGPTPLVAGYPGNPGSGIASPTIPSRTTGQIARSYRGR